MQLTLLRKLEKSSANYLIILLFFMLDNYKW